MVVPIRVPFKGQKNFSIIYDGLSLLVFWNHSAVSILVWWIHTLTHTNMYLLAQWVECSPIVQETWVQSQVASYQRLLKWYLIPPFFTLSNIRYVSRVQRINPRKGVGCPRLRSPTLLYFTIYIYVYIYMKIKITIRPLLSSPLWPWVVVSVRVPCIDQID